MRLVIRAHAINNTTPRTQPDKRNPKESENMAIPIKVLIELKTVCAEVELPGGGDGVLIGSASF